MKSKQPKCRSSDSARPGTTLKARPAKPFTRRDEARAATLRPERSHALDGQVVSPHAHDQVFTLPEAETPYRFLVEEMNEGALLLARDGTILYANARFADWVNLPPKQLVGTHWRQFFPAEEQARLHHLLQVAQGGAARQQLHLNKLGAAPRPVAVSLRCPRPGQVQVVVVTDLTDRMTAEAALSRTKATLENRVQQRTTELAQAQSQVLQLYRTLQAHTACSRALLEAEDEPAFLQQVCRVVAETCGYSLVWIGFAERDATRSVRVAASAGFEQTYLEALRISWAETERGQGPVGRAIRTAQPQISNNIQADPGMAPWRVEALRRGLASALALPLVNQAKGFGAIAIYAPKPNAFSAEEIELLNRLATDVSQGIITLRLREAHTQAEQALRHQRQLLETVVHCSPAATCLMRGSDLRIQLVNPAYQAIAPGLVMVGKTVDKVWPEAGESFREACLQVLATGQAHHAVDQLFALRRTPNGPLETAWFSWWLYRVRLPGEQGWGLLNTCWETTERVRAEAALRESERLYRAIGESIHYGIWLCDAQGRCTYVSQSFLDLVGMTQQQCSKFGWGKALHPEEAAATVAAWKQCVRTGGTWYREHRYRGVDGQWHPILACGVPVRNDQGHITAWAGINLDISRLKQVENALRASEEQFRTLADSMPNLAWWANADGSITWFNQRWYDYTGTTPEQMQGGGWQSVHDPQMLPQVMERWQACIASGGPFEMEFPLRGAAGQFRWFLTRVLPLRDAAGQIVRWFGTNTDVTDEREARLVLARSKEELERLVTERTAKLEELVGELEHFSYTITHDMRAPLRSMRGFAELVLDLLEAHPEPEPKALLRRIIHSAQRMDLLITDALSYSKAVRQELPLGPVDVGALLRGMLDSYPEFQSARAHITLQGEFPLVLGNQAGLTQCFSNLLANAIKFTQPGQPPQIRLWAEQVTCPTSPTSPPPAIRIWVEDHGIGIAKTMLPRIFSMFARGSDEHEGTGIGLALVRKVVDRMGGRVGVESEPGQGSRFWLELLAGDPRHTPPPVLPTPPPDVRTIL
jgi:PAS domain S-box-containing protein